LAFWILVVWFFPDIGLIDFMYQSTSDTNIQPLQWPVNWNITLFFQEENGPENVKETSEKFV
jgi:hypothetical protein